MAKKIYAGTGTGLTASCSVPFADWDTAVSWVRSHFDKNSPVFNPYCLIGYVSEVGADGYTSIRTLEIRK